MIPIKYNMYARSFHKVKIKSTYIFRVRILNIVTESYIEKISLSNED